jgi:hypothetical protein
VGALALAYEKIYVIGEPGVTLLAELAGTDDWVSDWVKVWAMRDKGAAKPAPRIKMIKKVGLEKSIVFMEIVFKLQ